MNSQNETFYSIELNRGKVQTFMDKGGNLNKTLTHIPITVKPCN
jgi:hypothetical protein